jgi:branched-chain amino acid transport system ATP-binding protein
MLEVSGLRVASGAMIRVDGLDLCLPESGSIALLGPNGAGKTASVEAISGLIRKAAGRVIFDGADITQLEASKIVRRGLTLVPQLRELFPNFSVHETLVAGSHAACRRAAIPFDTIYDLFPRLAERRDQLAGSLSGGEQQMLAVGRAMMLRPRLMLLDEPSFGLAPLIVQELFDILRTLNREESVSILLVEQNASLALDLADYAYLIETGRLVIKGPSRDIRDDETVRRSYLGY